MYKNNINYSNYILSVNNNIVSKNNINTKMILNGDIPSGNYILKISYNDYSFESSILIPSIYSLHGNGTIENPYQIYNEKDLNQIRYNMDAHYLLMNDIALTENWIPVGTYNNPFKGGFDGGNHRIMNFNIQEKNNNKVVGFFGYVEPKYSYQISQFDYINKDEKTYIKNVIFENPNVSNDGDASILIGKVIFNANNLPETAYNITNPPLCIDNIRFIDGNVISYEEDAGVIIGKIDIVTRAYIKPSLNINNIYSSTTISGKKSAGLIGYINDSYQSGSGVMLGITMKNFQNTGIIDETVFNIKYADENNYSPVIGGIYGNSKINLSNYIINSIFNDPGYMVNFTHYHGLNFIGYFDRETSKSLTYTLSNGYYVSRYSRNDFTSANKIKDSNIYSSWEDFDKYWKIENIDSITRIPVLKDIDYTYTSISDISLKKYDEVSLLSYVNQKSNYSYIDYEVISNDNIIVINNYDGFEKDITINVDSDVLKLPIITYCVNNGTDEEIYTQQVSSLKTFNLIKNKFVMNGYIFDSWNTETDGKGISYQDEASFNEGISEDLRLYAQWKPIKYTLKFNSNTGVGTMNDIKLNYDESKKIPANTFTKEGYVFVGWNTKADGTGISYSDNEEVLNLSSTENDIINLYAIWEKEYATITFDANGGEGNMNKIEVKVSDDIVLTENVFTKTGYAFKGWNTKQDGTGTSYNDMQNILVQDSITLYAQWTPIKYSLFLSDGMGNNKQQELTYDKEEKIVKNEFSKKGYIFAGWNTKQDGTGTRYDDEETIHNLADTENSVIPLYAEWTPISYKIIFYANGGMGWPHEEEFIYDVEKSLPKCTFTREGYSFTGWNTELDGSGQLYSSGRKVLNLIDENDGVFELYAQWVKNDNTIINNTKDYEGFYDEKEHSIDLNIEPSDYSIKYSINNTNYDLDELPKFKEVGEYTVNYKITKDGYEDLTGSNKVKIYGIRKLGDGISLKNDILITDNNKFVDVINNIDTYSKVTEFFHYDKDKKLVDGIVKTGDFIDVNINDSKSYLYKLSLLGDVNGDGKITSADYVKIRKHIMQTELIKDNLYFHSADVNDDNKISSADYVKIRKYIMNGESL